MELKDLQNFVMGLILVGVIIGVGVITLDNLGSSQRVDTGVSNETVTISSATGSVNFNNLTSVVYFGNDSTNTDQAGINTTATINWTTAGGFTVETTRFADGDYNVSYRYSRASSATTAVEQVNDSLTDIPSIWLPLIVTVAILAIVMFLVIRNYGGKKR
jgi:hypothetical protein|tara:strand:- start:147 stop:626 length:480 start_codon:yes stop_codon:yes gene_type:complete